MSLKNLAFYFLTLGLCFSAYSQDEIYLTVPPLNPSYPDIKELELIHNLELPDNPIKLEDLDYSIRVICGSYNPPDENEFILNYIRSNAHEVFKFEYQGVAEKWVPINGASEKFNVYRIR